MLTPKTGIFVVYGHDHEMRDATIKAIRHLSEQGFRVRDIVLDDKANITSDANFRENLKTRLEEARAAVVLLSPDDLGIARSLVQSPEMIALSDMERRPRQNVVWEYGYLSAKLNTKDYRIITRPESSDLFSDTTGLHVSRASNDEDIVRIVHLFVTEGLRAVRDPDPLGNADFAINYANLFDEEEPSDAIAVDIFDRQFDQLDNNSDKCLFLIERIVFDVYLHRPGWWQHKIQAIEFNDDRLRLMQDILFFVQSYMQAWRNPLSIDRITIATIGERMSSIQNRLNELDGKIAPIVPIVFHDYAGLTLHKMGLARRQRGDAEESLSYFGRSVTHLQNVLDIADRHEHGSLPLWRGFASYNRARVLRQLYDLESENYPESAWAQAYAEAIGHRERWRGEALFSYRFPTRLREGLEAEYIHALVGRRKDALRDNRGRITEKSEFRFDEEFEDRVRREYNAWQKKPEQDRVRLAEAIRANFDDVQEPKKGGRIFWPFGGN